MRVRYRPQARADIDEIGCYLRKRSPSGLETSFNQSEAQAGSLRKIPARPRKQIHQGCGSKLSLIIRIRFSTAHIPTLLKFSTFAIRPGDHGKENVRVTDLEIYLRVAAVALLAIATMIGLWRLQVQR